MITNFEISIIAFFEIILDSGKTELKHRRIGRIDAPAVGKMGQAFCGLDKSAATALEHQKRKYACPQLRFDNKFVENTLF